MNRSGWLAGVLGVVVALGAGCQPAAQPGASEVVAGRPVEPKYTDKTPEEWIGILRRGTVQSRQLATDCLIRYGSRSVPGLIEVVRDPRAGAARLAAARALGGIGRDAAPAVEALVEAMADTGWDARDTAAEALGMIGARGDLSVPALVASASDGDPILRMSCMRALGRMKASQPEAIECLAAALDDSDGNVQAEAANALAAIGPSARAAVASLEKASRSETFVVAQAASEALRAIRGQ